MDELYDLSRAIDRHRLREADRLRDILAETKLDRNPTMVYSCGMDKPTIYVAAKRIAEEANNGANDDTVMMLCDYAAKDYGVTTQFMWNLANLYAAADNEGEND